ncbi:MAG: hypothetical protein WDO12_05775 [Pseudomonadota bacterium]
MILTFGFTRFAGPHHEVASRFGHQREAMFGPALSAASLDVRFGLGAGEEEIIEDHFVEVPRGGLRDHLRALAVRRCVVRESLEAVAFIDGEGDAAGRLDAMCLEEGLGGFDGPVVRHGAVAMYFEIDLVHMHRRRDALPFAFEPCRVRHVCHFLCAHIHRDLEVLVSTSDAAPGCEQRQQRAA